MPEKLQSGAPMPALALPKVGGGEVSVGGDGKWRMVVVYRGRHCPLCKKYFARLEELKDGYAEAGVEIVAISCDPGEKAAADVEEFGWTFPVGYDLSIGDARALGLYISEPRSPQETDRPFAEPGIFVVNPEGRLHIVDISNAPFSRPDLANLLGGIKFIQSKRYPIRGTLG